MAVRQRERFPDPRPARDHSLGSDSSADPRTWGLLVGASALVDLFASFSETRPWPTAPWRDRVFLAHAYYGASEHFEALSHHPQQERLFELDDGNGNT